MFGSGGVVVVQNMQQTDGVGDRRRRRRLLLTGSSGLAGSGLAFSLRLEQKLKDNVKLMIQA